MVNIKNMMISSPMRMRTIPIRTMMIQCMRIRREGTQKKVTMNMKQENVVVATKQQKGKLMKLTDYFTVWNVGKTMNMNMENKNLIVCCIYYILLHNII